MWSSTAETPRPLQALQNSLFPLRFLLVRERLGLMGGDSEITGGKAGEEKPQSPSSPFPALWKGMDGFLDGLASQHLVHSPDSLSQQFIFSNLGRDSKKPVLSWFNRTKCSRARCCRCFTWSSWQMGSSLPSQASSLVLGEKLGKGIWE